MSVRAKSTLVMLVSYLLVYGWYFSRVLVAASRGPVGDIAYSGLLAAMVGVLVAVSVVANIVVATVARRSGADPDESDERDDLIELRGAFKGNCVLVAAVLSAMALAMVEAEPFWIAHALLGGLVLSEITRACFKLLDYRRGL